MGTKAGTGTGNGAQMRGWERVGVLREKRGLSGGRSCREWDQACFGVEIQAEMLEGIV